MYQMEQSLVLIVIKSRDTGPSTLIVIWL